MITTINYGSSPIPTAKLTINKNRVKVYEESTYTNNNKGVYYLNDEQEFEIELFNPTKQKMRADISLDGNIISQGGIILNPGERIYLERFIDENKKFMFKTYTVDGDDEEVKEAISNNGKLSIKFYRERITSLQYVSEPYWTIDNNQYTYYNTGSGNNNLGTDIGNNYILCSSTTNSIETGRTDKGSESDQTFVTTSGIFEYSPYHWTDYVIKPYNNKPITKKDIVVKRYCSQCGSKVKPK